MRYMNFVSVLVALVSLSLVSGAQIAFAEDYTEEYIIRVYRDIDFGGEMLELRIYRASDSGYYKVEGTRLGNFWDEEISSLSADSEPNAHWWLYRERDCVDLVLEGGGSRGDLRDYACNDSTRSFRIACPSNAAHVYLSVYEDVDFGGEHVQFKLWRSGTSGEHVVLAIPQLDGHWNDEISSIYTGSSTNGVYECYFHVDANHSGGGRLLSSSEGNSEDKDLRDDNLNDKITSIQLRIYEDESDLSLPTLTEWGGMTLVILLLCVATGLAIRRRKVMDRNASA